VSAESSGPSKSNCWLLGRELWRCAFGAFRNPTANLPFPTSNKQTNNKRDERNKHNKQGEGNLLTEDETNWRCYHWRCYHSPNRRSTTYQVGFVCDCREKCARSCRCCWKLVLCNNVWYDFQTVSECCQHITHQCFMVHPKVCIKHNAVFGVFRCLQGTFNLSWTWRECLRMRATCWLHQFAVPVGNTVETLLAILW